MPDEIKSLLIKTAIVIAIIVAGIVITYLLLQIVRKAMKKTETDPLLQAFFVNVIKVVMICIIAAFTLEILGVVNLSHFITVLGVTGAAVAIAVKDTLANIAGGINIIVTLPFKHGDYVKIEDVEGVIEETKLMMTTLRTADNKQITIPNNKVANSVIVNHSARDIRRVAPAVVVGDDDDLIKVKEILFEVAASCPLVLSEPAPFVGVAAAKYGRVDLTFYVWCNTGDYYEVLYFMNETIKVAFDEAGIGWKQKGR